MKRSAIRECASPTPHFASLHAGYDTVNSLHPSFRDAPLGAGPESIRPAVVMDSGFARKMLAPRNDGVILRRDIRIKISPIGILVLNQPDFPIATPLLQFFLSRDGIGDVVINLEPDQLVDIVAFGETVDSFGAMLIGASHNIVGHAEVERAVFLLASR